MTSNKAEFQTEDKSKCVSCYWCRHGSFEKEWTARLSFFFYFLRKHKAVLLSLVRMFLISPCVNSSHDFLYILENNVSMFLCKEQLKVCVAHVSLIHIWKILRTDWWISLFIFTVVSLFYPPDARYKRKEYSTHF